MIRSPNRSRTSVVGVSAALGLLATGCLAENIKTDFPPGLDPIDAVNPAEFPAGTVGDPFPETLGAFAYATAGDVNLVYAKGYVKRPLADVWAAGVDPQTSAEARSSVDSCTITLDVETGYDYSWMVHYKKSESIAHVEFDVTWRSGTLPWPTPPGGPPSPLQVAWRFQKTNGTAYIQVMAGSLLAYEVPGVVPAVTKLEFIRHVNAARSPPDVVAAGIQNHYDSILAKLNGTTNPTAQVCTGP